MNLRQLQHVVALADYRNFHRAADAAGVSQPGLTQSIQNLEDEFGVALFARTKRDVSPTAFGNAVIQSARQVLAQLSNLHRELDLMKNLQSGRLIVGSDAWVAEAVLSPVLANMLDRYPGLRFSVRVGLIETLQEEILAGGIDLYVGAPPETRDGRMRWHEICLPPLVMACKPHHPILSLPAPSATDCLAYPIASPVLSRSYRDWLDKQLGRPATTEGRSINSSFLESDDFAVIRRLVRTTEALTAMLPSLIADDLERGTLCVVPVPEVDFPMPAIICHASARPLAPAAEILLTAVMAQAEQLFVFSQQRSNG